MNYSSPPHPNIVCPIIGVKLPNIIKKDWLVVESVLSFYTIFVRSRKWCEKYKSTNLLYHTQAALEELIKSLAAEHAVLEKGKVDEL